MFLIFLFYMMFSRKKKCTLAAYRINNKKLHIGSRDDELPAKIPHLQQKIVNWQQRLHISRKRLLTGSKDYTHTQKIAH